MDAETIVSRLNAVWHFEVGSRVDFEQTGEFTFRATEVRPDLTVGRRIVGYLSDLGGPVSVQEPDLSIEQAKVYESVLRGVSGRIHEGEASNASEFLLIRDGEYPELFHPLDFIPANIPGNAREGMLPVWHAIEDMVQQSGYKVVKMRQSGAPWEIWAHPLNRPRY